MKLAIMQPYFMPYIGYFQAINAVDKYILYDNLNFIKDAWVNRNRLLLRNGTITTFSVPIIAKSSHTEIVDIRIDNSQKWDQKVLKTIFLNYKKTAYFDEVFPLLETILSTNCNSLSELNVISIKSIAEFLTIDTVIEYDNSKYISLEDNLLLVDQQNYSPFAYLEETQPIKKVARVIAICKTEGASSFINAIGGQSLYSREEFAKYGIDLKFVQTDADLRYNQFSHGFASNLSIIDVLMHNGKEGTKQLLNAYKLI